MNGQNCMGSEQKVKIACIVNKKSKLHVQHDDTIFLEIFCVISCNLMFMKMRDAMLV